MKALLGFVVVLVVLLVVTPAALDRWVDTQVVEVGAARAALAMEKAKQAAIETEALRRQADLDARVAAVSAAHQIELNLAWQSIEFVFVLAMAGAVVAGVYGLVAAGVQAARLRARLIYPQAGMASGVYPLVSTPQGVIEPPAPRLATRREPPALTAAPAAPVMIEPPAPPDLVDLRTWQGDGLPLGVSAAGPVSVALDGSWSLGLVAGLPGMGKSTALRCMLAALARAPAPVHVAICDCKGAEFTALAGRRLLWAPIARSADEVAGLLNLVDTELQRRFGLLAAHDADNFRAVGLAPLLLVIDELSIVAQNRDALTAITNLARLGRSAGVLTIAATQRPTAASISGDLRALTDWALVFAVERRGEAMVCGVPGAESLPRRPGRGLFRRGATVELQAYACPGWRGMMRSLPAAIEGPAQTRIEGSAQIRVEAAPAVIEGSAQTRFEAERERILRLHANGMSLSAIARTVYGTAGGAAFYQVKAVLTETDTTTG